MKNFIARMKQIELEISNEHGPFELFALFRPDTTLRLWDVLVSAKWMGQNELGCMRIVAKPMNHHIASHGHAQRFCLTWSRL